MNICPRCHTPLVAADYPMLKRFDGRDTLPIHRCEQCQGIAVAMKHNVDFLDALSADLAELIDFDTPVEPYEGHTAPAACPHCQGPTTRFGYLGTNRVFLDRCTRCMVLWHDGDELAVTAVLHARTATRRLVRDAAQREAIKHLNTIAHIAMSTQVGARGGFHTLLRKT